MTTITKLKAALSALDCAREQTNSTELEYAYGIAAKDLRSVIAEMEAGEPVAICHDDGYWTPLKTEAGRKFNYSLNKAGTRVTVYTHPQPKAEPSMKGIQE